MVKVNEEEWDVISEAIIIWSGWTVCSYPSRSEERVVSHFGKSKASVIMPLVLKLEDDFYSTEARYKVDSLSDMAKLASEMFLDKYPNVSQDAVRALAWCYTFDYK